ncbi:hypothetical protein Dda_0067 [Drechslerella dactyloides]|uniref:Uncharacterized protein n=1 Tax=Drechslerella dactyloides TaxID=74499 RepID=A0AAD6J426_DREDA|nr:hypothetical protein Dda_0067 [Drechslerella dactyloides]
MELPRAGESPSPMEPPHANFCYAEDDYVEELFHQTKSSTKDINSNYICNADLSEDALEKIFKGAVPDFKSVEFSAGLMHTSCLIEYTMERRDRPDSNVSMTIYQCDSSSEATSCYRGSLNGYNIAPKITQPEPANSAGIGSYALGGRCRLKFVRDTVFVDIKDSSDCLTMEEFLKLGKDIDNHLIAGRVETARKKTIPSCILRCSEKMSVPVGQFLKLTVRDDEDHYNIVPEIENLDLILHLGVVKNGELWFQAFTEGVTRIGLTAIHNKTFHTTRSRLVEVTITPVQYVPGNPPKKIYQVYVPGIYEPDAQKFAYINVSDEDEPSVERYTH